MRPPPFILVLKSNAPGPSKMAGTRGGRMFFRESEFVSKTEHVERSGRWLSASALRVHGPHSGAAGSFGTCPAYISIASHAASQGQHGGTAFPVLPGALAFLFSDDKWVRASARKLRRRPLAASQTLCLPPTQRWVKQLLLRNT